MLLSGIGVASPAAVGAAPPGVMISVPQTLARMVDASRTLSYRGVAVYEQGGTARTVSVVHAVRDGRELERLEYLDGPRSELVRRSEPNDCNPVTDRLLKGDAVAGGGARVRLSDHYRASFRSDDRIAGRMVRQIYMEPRDKYRYGHLLGVDAVSGLLLQDLVLDARAGIVERIRFTTIEIGALIDEAAGEALLRNYAVVASANCPEPARPPDGGGVPWQAAWVPPGFVLLGPPRVTRGGAQEMHYTDGLGPFSVFIDAETSPPRDVEVRRGATVVHVLHRRDGDRGYVICVVGELPPPIARRIAEGVRPAPGPR